MTERGEQLTKRVDYIQKDDDTQTATGVVMVPWTVDHHGDWERPETIAAFADQFDAFVDAGEADGGVMHAVWPSDWMALERNEVLDDAETIGGDEVPEGAWIQTWSYHDDELWSLVEDDILDGHSIGAVNVDWEYSGEDPDDLPDEVSVPDEVDVHEYWELVDGIIREVSAVDIPAVPDARILETSKARAATAEKRLADHLGNRDGFLEEAQERGHDEAAAERLWELLNRAVNVEGAGEPGTKSRLTEAAKSFLNALTGPDDDGTDTKTSEALGGADESTDKNAAGGETPADGGTTTAAGDSDMSNPDDEPPEWAKNLQEQIDEQSKRLDDALDGDGDADGETDAFADAPEWAKALKEDVDKQSERIDAISKQTGTTESQQLGGAETGGTDTDSQLGDRQKFFIPESKRRA